MTHIYIKKGLNIPIEGSPTDGIQLNIPSGETYPLNHPSQIALTFEPFSDLRFKLLAKPGEVVKIGQPLAEDKSTPGRMFLSPAGGVIVKEERGAKRVLQALIIDVAQEEEYFHHDRPSQEAGKDELIAFLLKTGAFSFLQQRPFCVLAHPSKKPKAIFVKALESAPFTPPAEVQIEGYEQDFQMGLDALNKICPHHVHVVCYANTPQTAFSHAKNVQIHTAEGPHPIANHSLHIQRIAPITSINDVIWTATVRDVAMIGHAMRTGHYLIDKVVAVAGPGVLTQEAGYYKCRLGYPISALIEGRIFNHPQRLISGDPLTGHVVKNTEFLGYYDTVLSVIPENLDREFLHFFRLGLSKYSFSKAYLTGHLNNENREYPFTTNLHGEHRAFIDSSLYDKVMPLDIPTMQLVKAVIAQDFELAQELGLLEVHPEDFALPAFVCPSKMEMVQLMRQGIKQYAAEMQT